MTKEAIPVILADSELRSQEGLLASFGIRRIPIIALSSVSNSTAFKSRFVSKSVISPSVEKGKEYIKFLLDLPYRGVLIYSGDISAELISESQAELIHGGYSLNIAELDTFEKVFDKWQCYTYCKSIGINTPQSFLADTIENTEKGWKALSENCIIKATRLAGGIYRKVENKNNLESNYKEMENIISSPQNKYRKSSLMTQEVIECGIRDIWCSESLYNKRGECAGVLCIQKIRTCFNSDGTFGSRLYVGKVIGNRRLEELTKKLLNNLHWKGFVHLDWIFSKKEQDYFLTDFNPRLPGFSNLLFRSGFDIGYGYYADLLNLPTSVTTKKCIYFECFRVPGDISGGIGAIAKKRITLKEFIFPYFYISNPNYKKVFDVFMLEDPLYTFLSWCKDTSSFLIRKFGRISKLLTRTQRKSKL
ncbi:MAG: hypothetical protein WCI77_04365 [Candidatus Omnitrophota bacterium]